MWPARRPQNATPRAAPNGPREYTVIRIAILGGGTAGTMLSSHLAHRLHERDVEIRVYDRDDAHIYQPGLLFLPFGGERLDRIVRPRKRYIAEGVELVLDEVVRVDPDRKELGLQSGAKANYDVLVVATGARLDPSAIQGLAETYAADLGAHFYDLEGSLALGRLLAGFEGGRIIVNVAEMPIKCPVAPHEMSFLLESYLRARGIREKSEIVFATPLPGAFTKPKASAVLGDMMGQRGIEVVADFNLADVDPATKKAHGYDGRELDFDLFVGIPPHRGSTMVAASGLGDADGWLPTDKHTLQSKAHPDIWALGDGTDLPTSKAGAVAHFQAEVLTENLLAHLDGRPPVQFFDGHANCFIETGDGKAMLIDFNYETEPLPGRFPLPGVGPFTLLGESELNHWGKLGFRWVYWNLLMRGRALPLDHRLMLAGKER